MDKYKRFYNYWKDLYGQDLGISGWHLNGELEPFDNFFELAVRYMEEDVHELWDEFGDVPRTRRRNV